LPAEHRWSPADDPLRLILEVTGPLNRKKEAKAATAEALWIPAVNAGGWGRWAFLEIRDPWDAAGIIRRFLQGLQPA
jgi:type III restriction enzyme